MADTVIQLMSEGAALVEVAAALGVSRDTVNRWSKDEDKPEFSDAIKKGIELSEAWWMREGRTSLRDKDFNHGLWYMNMKNRFGWSDRQQVQHSGGDTPVQIIYEVVNGGE